MTLPVFLYQNISCECLLWRETRTFLIFVHRRQCHWSSDSVDYSDDLLPEIMRGRKLHSADYSGNLSWNNGEQGVLLAVKQMYTVPRHRDSSGSVERNNISPQKSMYYSLQYQQRRENLKLLSIHLHTVVKTGSNKHLKHILEFLKLT